MATIFLDGGPYATSRAGSPSGIETCPEGPHDWRGYSLRAAQEAHQGLKPELAGGALLAVEATSRAGSPSGIETPRLRSLARTLGDYEPRRKPIRD